MLDTKRCGSRTELNEQSNHSPLPPAGIVAAEQGIIELVQMIRKDQQMMEGAGEMSFAGQFFALAG